MTAAEAANADAVMSARVEGFDAGVASVDLGEEGAKLIRVWADRQSLLGGISAEAREALLRCAGDLEAGL